MDFMKVQRSKNLFWVDSAVNCTMAYFWVTHILYYHLNDICKWRVDAWKYMVVWTLCRDNIYFFRWDIWFFHVVNTFPIRVRNKLGGEQNFYFVISLFGFVFVLELTWVLLLAYSLFYLYSWITPGGAQETRWGDKESTWANHKHMQDSTLLLYHISYFL